MCLIFVQQPVGAAGFLGGIARPARAPELAYSLRSRGRAARDRLANRNDFRRTACSRWRPVMPRLIRSALPHVALCPSESRLVFVRAPEFIARSSRVTALGRFLNL